MQKAKVLKAIGPFVEGDIATLELDCPYGVTGWRLHNANGPTDAWISLTVEGSYLEFIKDEPKMTAESGQIHTITIPTAGVKRIILEL
jgi:hypothetical protein